MPGTPILTQQETQIKTIIEGLKLSGGYHYTWGTVNIEDLAKCTFPCGMVYLDPEEENLDDPDGASAQAYTNMAKFRIRVVGTFETEQSNPIFAANATLTKALDDLKKAFGINYSLNDTADYMMYKRSVRISSVVNDIMIPKMMDTFWETRYIQSRTSPDTVACV